MLFIYCLHANILLKCDAIFDVVASCYNITGNWGNIASACQCFTKGKLSNEETMCIQTLFEQRLVAKAIKASYSDKTGNKAR